MVVSSAREKRSRSSVSTSAPTNTASAILTVSEARSGCLVPAVTAPSFLATSRNRIAARIVSSIHSRRRTGHSSSCSGARQGRAAGGKLGHDAAALVRRHGDPAADLDERAAAADAKPAGGVDDAHLVARRLDGGRAVGLGHQAGDAVAARIGAAIDNAIMALTSLPQTAACASRAYGQKTARFRLARAIAAGLAGPAPGSGRAPTSPVHSGRSPPPRFRSAAST